MKYKDALSEELIDLITYYDDLQGERKRIEKKLIELEKEKPPPPPIQSETPDVTINPLNQQPTQSSPSTILQPSATTSSLTQSLQAEEPQQAVIIPVVEGIPLIESAGYAEALALFKQLRKEGKIDKKITQDKPSDTAASGKVKKGVEDYIILINQVPGYENWKPKLKPSGAPRKDENIIL